MSDVDDYDGVHPLAHKKLLSEVNEIIKNQHIKRPRNEASLKKSEFNLVKNFEDGIENIIRKNTKVSISSVAQTVQKNTKQRQIGKQLKNAFKSDNILSKPLEKVSADRLRRTIAYDNSKAKLGCWDAVVAKNQNAQQLKFPLVIEKAQIKRNGPERPIFRYKTQMMKDIEVIQNECFPQLAKIESSNPQELLTLEEIKERRKEFGRLKSKESHKILKQRMQSKIKSKKYHKLMKREELKRKIKDFEELKLTNPEAALKELEKIDRQRVQERTTLRHRNTGTWAQNLQVRAKYDANVKQDLEIQLALGRELTQKEHQFDSSESDSEEDTITVANGSENPWLGLNNQIDPLDEVFSGYRKFWEEHNVNEKLKKKFNCYTDTEPVEDVSLSYDDDISDVETRQSDTKNYINDLFDAKEDRINVEMVTKLSELKPKLLKSDQKTLKRNNIKKRGSNVSENYLGFAKTAKLGDMDDALNEGNVEFFETHAKSSKHLLNEIEQRKEQIARFMKGGDEINPESFLSIKSKHLITAIPKSQQFDEVDDEFQVEQLSKNNKQRLAEAFSNDDIANDFKEEVENDFKKIAGTEQLTAPGWGSWGGHGVKRKIAAKKEFPDAKKKDRIIIRSAPNEKLQKHLISSVPFPFKSIQDFEASMQLPIGRDFVPESAHRKLTLQSVVTKAGTIIDPMTEDVLVQSGSVENKIKKRSRNIASKKLKPQK